MPERLYVSSLCDSVRESGIIRICRYSDNTDLFTMTYLSSLKAAFSHFNFWTSHDELDIKSRDKTACIVSKPTTATSGSSQYYATPILLEPLGMHSFAERP